MLRSNRLGKLIVFEGPDGVGKTTIAREVADALRSRGYPCELLSFPGRDAGTLGGLVYEIHHDPLSHAVQSMAPAAMQALHLAAHLDAIERLLLPTLRTERHVLLDRFWWSTWVYGIVGGAKRSVLHHMIAAELSQWGSVVPAAAVVLRRPSPIDREHDLGHWLALREAYDELAHSQRKRHPVLIVENLNALNEVRDDIVEQLIPLLRSGSPKRRRNPSSAAGHQLPLDLTGNKPRAAPTTLIRSASPRPSAVFDTFWRFAVERQETFFKRLAGAPPPWTTDPILAQYKFTNVYRASDRVSQYLIRRVIYRDDLPASSDEVFFRIVLFKLFNKIETWEALERTLGRILHAEYTFERYDEVLSRLMRERRAIYSAAYIMPPGGRWLSGDSVKHRNHLRLLERMMAEAVPDRITATVSMQQGFELLRAYPMIGNFLAYQFITDINYSELTHFSEMEFVVPGPGALDGIRKCFTDPGMLSEPDLIRWVAERQEAEFSRRGLEFRPLFGRPLQLIDYQNLFCEVDKYARIAHPDIPGRSGRTRIKQQYQPSSASIQYWYPPKWGINQIVEAYQATHGSVRLDDL